MTTLKEPDNEQSEEWKILLAEGILEIIDVGLNEDVIIHSAIWSEMDFDKLESFLDQKPTALKSVFDLLLGDVESRLRNAIDKRKRY